MPYADDRRKLIDMRQGPHRSSGRRSEAGQERHDLSERRRQGPQLRLVHPEQLSRLRQPARARRPRLRPAKPRQPVRPRRQAPQPPGAAQATVPHDHPRHGDEGRPSRTSSSASWEATSRPRGSRKCWSNMIDFGMNVQEAGEAPRIEHVGSPTPTGKPGDPKGGAIQAGTRHTRRPCCAIWSGAATSRRRSQSTAAATRRSSSIRAPACCTAAPKRARTDARRGIKVDPRSAAVPSRSCPVRSRFLSILQVAVRSSRRWMTPTVAEPGP